VLIANRYFSEVVSINLAHFLHGSSDGHSSDVNISVILSHSGDHNY